MIRWPVFVPLGAALLLATTLLMPLGTVLAVFSVLALVASVLAAVHHAEVVAHRVGEPFGTLVLALAITAIEVVLIVSLMLAFPPPNPRHRLLLLALLLCDTEGGLGIHPKQSAPIAQTGLRLGNTCSRDTTPRNPAGRGQSCVVLKDRSNDYQQKLLRVLCTPYPKHQPGTKFDVGEVSQSPVCRSQS